MSRVQAALRQVWILRGTTGARRGLASKSVRDSILDEADFNVVIVGRPNVGKSSLLNRLIGKKLALVYDQPGVTRDTIQATTELGGLKMRLTDTAGLDDGIDVQDAALGTTKKKGTAIAVSGIGRWPAHLLVAALEQTTRAVKESSLALMIVDATVGITPLDVQFSRWLLRLGRPALLVVNKSDRLISPLPDADLLRMGLGEPVYISVTRNDGITELISLVHSVGASRSAKASAARSLDQDAIASILEESGVEMVDRMLRMCVMGRPNAGKSTMINKILEKICTGEEGKKRVGRLLTGPEPGVTRDPVPVKIVHKGKEVLLVDTAGLRRKATVMNNNDPVDIATSLATLNEIKWCQVCVLLLDATEEIPLTHQDLTIVASIAKQGKGVVLALNKVDVLSEKVKKKILKDKDVLLRQMSTQLGGVPFVLTSSIDDKGLDALLDICMKTHDKWRKRITTHQLMNWVIDLKRVGTNMSRRFPTPKFARQVDAGPPSIVITCRHPDKSTKEFETFLTSSLRKRFNFDGVPINLIIRGDEEDEDKKKDEGEKKQTERAGLQARRTKVVGGQHGIDQGMLDDDVRFEFVQKKQTAKEAGGVGSLSRRVEQEDMDWAVEEHEEGGGGGKAGEEGGDEVEDPEDGPTGGPRK